MPSSDNSHCHDDQCIQAPLCWRYTTRLTIKWASHVMTFREAQDRAGAQCTYFIPTREDDNRDNAR